MSTTEAARPLVTDPELDLAARSFWAQPWAAREKAFARLRNESPVSWHRPYESELLPPADDTPGFWALTRYEDIRDVSRDPELFCSAQGITMEDFPEVVAAMSQSFLAMDDPEHALLRGIVAKAFSPGRMRKIDDWIGDNARQLVEEMIDLGEGDFCELFAKQLPARIFADFFGVPEGEHRATLIDAAERMLAWDDPEAAAGRSALETYAEEAQRMADIAFELAEERAAKPGDDLLTWIVEADVDGKRMETWEVGSFFVLLSAAANDTTRHTTSHAIDLLTRHPEQRDLLLEDLESRLDGAAEEIVRYASPVMHFRRTATRDTEIRGVPIAAGDKVVIWYCSGNMDEEAFEDPHRFDILRQPNRHLGFGGGGPHYCMGSALGRQMVKAALREVYTRMPDIEAGEPEYMVSNFLHSVRRLPVRWTPPR